MRRKELPALDSLLRRLMLFRLFLPLVALSVVVITGVGYLSIQTLENQQQQRVQFVAQNIDDYLDEAARSLNAVARVAEAASSKNLAFMQATLEANMYFDTLYYVDASGKFKYIVPPDPHYLGLDVTSLPYFQQTGEKNNISISRPFISMRTGKPTVYLVRKLSEGGWVVSELSLGSLQDEITRRSTGNDVIFIMDKSGTLLAHPDADLVKQQTNQSYLEIFRRGLERDTTMVYEYAETMVIGSATRVKRTGWVVMDKVPVSIALGPYAWALGLALLGSLAIWLVLMWRLRNQLEGHVAIPLAQLSRGTNALAKGNFRQGKALTSVPGAFSELNELAADFQHMSDALEARQAQLQESEELNRLTLSNIVDAVFVTDDTGLFIYICPNVDIIFGYSLEEVQAFGNIEYLMGKELFSPDELETSQRLTNIEREISDKFGGIHSLIINIVRVDIKGGTYLYTCHDITERKQAEDALRESEAKYRLIVETASEGICMLGSDTSTTFVNARMAKMLGYSIERIVGRQLTDFMFEEDIQDHLKKMKGRRRGVSEQYQRRFRRKNGKVLWTLVSATPVFDSEHCFQGSIAMFTDITDRKRIESELQEALENLERSLRFNEALLSSIPNPVFFKDREGRYLGCNIAFTELMGVTSEQIKGKTVGELWPSEFAEIYHEKDLELMRNPVRQLYEYKVKDKDGQEHPVVYCKDVFRDENDQVAGIIGAFTDITELKKAEEALRESEAKQRQRLEALVEERTHELLSARDAAELANRAKSIFLANMSHELRTPLNAILGFAQLMSRDELIPDHAKQNLAIINRSGEHLLSMINDVLDLSKIEAGKAELKEEPFDLVQTIKDIGEMIRARAREKHLEVIVDLDPGIQQFVRADLGKIRQILINLLGNAVKFTDDGGIALRARTVPSTDNTAKALLEIEVEDTGPGMPEDRLDAIFTPFTQVGTAKSSLMGTGLGLTISQSYARMMDGNISARSKEGKGSIFKLLLSVEIASQEMVSPTEMQQAAVIGIEEGEPDYRILIVEDNYENAILLETLLDQAGLSTQIAGNGKEGVEMAEAWRPHFIWMDMKMPVMDGYEATRFIRLQPWGKEIVIAAFTASVFSDQENAVAEVGCNCIVRKPFRSQEIFDAMSKHLGIRFKYSKIRDEESAGIHQTKKTEKPSISELKALTKNVVKDILKAAVELDKHSILTIADEFAQTNPNLSVYLKNHASSYDFEAIEMLFSSITNKKAS